MFTQSGISGWHHHAEERDGAIPSRRREGFLNNRPVLGSATKMRKRVRHLDENSV
jgi:hypothetical protein